VSWIVLAGVVLTFGGSVLGYLGTRRKIAEVHVLVNSQLAAVVERVAQLTATLEQAGVAVPPE
jgi:hypothetical protein